MDPRAGFTAFLDTVRPWLANGTDAEVRALAVLVRAELQRRGLAPEGTEQQTS